MLKKKTLSSHLKVSEIWSDGRVQVIGALQHCNLPAQTRWFFLSGNYNYKNISLVKKKAHI